MSKIKQALNYEQALADAKLRAAHDLLSQATDYEHQLGAAKFHEIESIQSAHSEFHDREHILYEDAIDKASLALKASHANLQAEVKRLADASANFMTTDRFEREHAQLFDRVDAAFARVDEKLGAEGMVTAKQSVREQTLEEIATGNGVNRRWLIALVVTGLIMFGALIVNLFAVLSQTHAV